MIRSHLLQRQPTLALLKAPLLLLVTFIGAFWLYARTAAPSVLSGDSGEFQFAASLLGVPHPTGYPLYILLGKLATLLPVGDIAHRVTLVASLAGAGTVALLALLLLRVTGSMPAALIAAVALTVAPGLWHLSTIAEVYTLNTLLLTLLALLLWHAHDWQNTETSPPADPAADAQKRVPNPQSPIPSPQALPPNPRYLYAAALVTGLGVSHHASFAFTGAPLLLVFGLLPLLLSTGTTAPAEQVRIAVTRLRRQTWFLVRLALAGLLGLTPWLFVLVQYARWGPFAGLDHGLPQAYFWGAPTSWGEALAHLTGGTLRGGVFDPPGPRTLLQTALTLWERLQFEFGPLGVTLGVLGCYRLLRRPLWLWLGSTWVAGVTALYFASLGPAVQDAPVFTLPLLLPWACWIGIGATALVERVKLLLTGTRMSFLTSPASRILLVVCLLLTLGWGQTRLPYGNKADQWLFRTFGEGVLAEVAPEAVVLTRWEQGTILHYLRLVEGRRPDVWVDIVELEDISWQERIQVRYPDRQVYIIGSNDDAAALGAEHVWGTDYAALFRLEPGNDER
ncbi:MAG: protein O-mannosyl-transferase family [Chloroflexaceae bacterium]